MYVRRLNNYQNSLLPTFLWFFKIFPFLQIFLNGFFDHVRKLLQMYLHGNTRFLFWLVPSEVRLWVSPCLLVYAWVASSSLVRIWQKCTKMASWRIKIFPSFFHTWYMLSNLFVHIFYRSIFCCCISDNFCMLYVFI